MNIGCATRFIPFRHEEPRALVTGSAGLIGSAVVEHLADWWAVAEYDIKYGLGSAISPKMLDVRYDALIDCARYDRQEDQVSSWKAVIDHFKKWNRGKIILFSSIYGHKAPDFSIYDGTEINKTPLEYAMSKGGIEQATRYLAQELKPYNIQVNCIAPGGVIDKHSANFRRLYFQSGKAHMIETRNLLPVIDCLLHPDNAINGQVITVDGGWTL